MDEFNSRMDAQRAVLNVINGCSLFKEELCGLSRKALARWIGCNQIAADSELATTLLKISERLFFLAARSQEQVTEDYRLLSQEVRTLTRKIESILSSDSADTPRQPRSAS